MKHFNVLSGIYCVLCVGTSSVLKYYIYYSHVSLFIYVKNILYTLLLVYYYVKDV